MDIINPYIHGEGAAPAAFDGFGNRSRSLDGSSDYISIPDINESTTNLSVALWLKTTDQDWVTTHFAHWRNQDNNRAWWIGPSRTAETNGKKLMVYLSGGGAGNATIKRYYGTTDVSDGTWHHVAFTWDNGTLKLFVDGSEETTTKVANDAMTSIYNSDGDLTVGCTLVNDLPANFGSGGRADIRIYNSTLTATDISDIYNGTNITTNLVGHWLTDADNVLDAAGTNHGTNYGSKYSYDNPSPPVEFGSASRSFDGVNDYITTADFDTTFDGGFSIAFWAKLDDGRPASTVQLFGVNTTTNQCRIALTASGEFRGVYISNNNVSVADLATSLTNGQQAWVHYAWIVTPTGQKIYVDGSEATLDGTNDGDMTGVTMSAFSTGLKFFIGAYNNNGSANQFAAGNYADFRIYDAELTASQISDLYSGTDVQTNLVGHWLTNNDDVEDKAGTNDGTNFGSTYSYNAPLPANKLIDTYASACGAYSLRELTTAWAGQPVVEVRRVSDGAYSDFTASEITDGTLATWCQGTGAFVRTWYDQSGNGIDVTQTTEGNQPRIATNGVVESDNGKPAINFDTTVVGFSNAGSFDYEGGVSWYAVTHTTVNSSQDRVWCDDKIGEQGFVIFYTDGTNYINDGTGYKNHSSSGGTTNQQLRSYNFDESQGWYVYGFDGSFTDGFFGGWGGSIEKIDTCNIAIGQAGAGGHSYQGKMQELIIYPNDQRHNKENIERNINEFYSIY